MIAIPEPVRDDLPAVAARRRCIRARRLEKALDTPARIYYKYEGVSPAGSHKPNTAVAQAFYNKEAGVRRLATETGAGQWGSSLAFAGALFGLEVQGLHGAGQLQPEAVPPGADGDLRRAMRRQPQRPRPTPAGAILAEHPDSPGSLGIAISEAVEVAAQNADTKYALGCVLNHVLLHQTVIGQEAIAADRDGRTTIPTSSSAAPAAARTSPASPSRSWASNCAAGGRCGSIAVEPAACPC